MRRACLALAGVLAITTGTAATLEGVTLPASQQVDGKSLSLNGMGLRSKLMIDVYVAGLYLVNASSDANTIINSDVPKRVVLQFLRDVSKAQMVDAYTEAFDNNASAAKAGLSKEIASLMAAFEPVSAGDQMVFTYVPGQGTTLAVKGQDKVTIAGLPFARAMFACWLGPKPPSTDFKKGLLGK